MSESDLDILLDLSGVLDDILDILRGIEGERRGDLENKNKIVLFKNVFILTSSIRKFLPF